MISNKKFLEYQLKAERKIADLEEQLSKERLARKNQEQEYLLELQNLRHEQEIKELKAKAYAHVLTEEEKDEAVRRKKQAGALLAYCEDRETLEKLGFKMTAEDGNE